MPTYKNIPFVIYESPKWNVNCTLCDFETGTHSKKEAEYWIKQHISIKHSETHW